MREQLIPQKGFSDDIEESRPNPSLDYRAIKGFKSLKVNTFSAKDAIENEWCSHSLSHY